MLNLGLIMAGHGSFCLKDCFAAVVTFIVLSIFEIHLSRGYITTSFCPAYQSSLLTKGTFLPTVATIYGFPPND